MLALRIVLVGPLHFGFDFHFSGGMVETLSSGLPVGDLDMGRHQNVFLRWIMRGASTTGKQKKSGREGGQ
jgi:hypothetical protein